MKIKTSSALACAEALKRGQCIAYPTEAVWGLGCDPFNRSAVHEILRMKQRPLEKGLIIVAASVAQVQFLLHDIPPATLETMLKAWPGHTTWLIPHHDKIPDYISGDSAKVAVRVSAHPVVQAIGRAYGHAFVSTSANPAGLPSAVTREEVLAYFPNEATLVVSEGEVGGATRASTIIDAETSKVVRA